MLGGAGGGCWDDGGGDLEVTSGQAKEKQRGRFGAEGKTLAGRQDCWRETDPLAAFGG